VPPEWDGIHDVEEVQGSEGEVEASSNVTELANPPVAWDLLVKHYKIGDKLGEGTFGVVRDCWKLSDPIKKVHAVKYIDKAAQDKDMILLETNMIQQLDHDNVVKCLDVFNEPCFMCIVMEKWEGRDVVSRLIEYTEAGKEVPEPCVSNLVRQMMASLAYIHAKTIVHRDVKMDNYLLDRPVLDDLNVRVALSDFGCATYLPSGERLDESVGTKVYKSPEFIMEDYDHKVDVWAVGVSMYALLAGTLPFETERAILQVRPSYPDFVGQCCLDLLKQLLLKNDDSRPCSGEALAHPFLAQAQIGPGDHIRKAPSLAASTKSIKHLAVRNEVVDESIVERREVLMARIIGACAGKEQGPPIIAKDFRVHLGNGGAKESRLFSWWSPEEVLQTLSGHLPKSLSSARSSRQIFGSQRHSRLAGYGSPYLMDIAWTPQVVEDLLLRHKVDVNLYGTGTARTVEAVADEIRKGDAVLMQDGSRHKKLVRLVDSVVLQIDFDFADSTGYEQRLLSHRGVKRLVLISNSASQEHEGLGSRLPCAQRRPHETTRQVALRLLDSELQMPGCEFTLNYEGADRVEAVEHSDQYPSLPTIKRRHIIPGKLKVLDPVVARTVGLGVGCIEEFPNSARNKEILINFSQAVGDFAWWTPNYCKSRRVSLINAHASQNLGKFSALVRVPLHFSEAIVSRLLWSYGFDTSKFGPDAPDRLTKLAAELSKGESRLCELKGKVVRVASVVLMRIEDTTTGRTLVEVEHVGSDGSSKDTKRLPGLKLRPQEDLHDAIARLVKQRLQLDLTAVRVLQGKTEVIEEERESDDYPGFQTLYRMHLVTAEVTTASVADSSTPTCPETEATACPPSDGVMDVSDQDSQVGDPSQVVDEITEMPGGIGSQQLSAEDESVRKLKRKGLTKVRDRDGRVRKPKTRKASMQKH